MSSNYPLFDTSRLQLSPLSERRHDLDLSVIMELSKRAEIDPALSNVASNIRKARQAVPSSSVILMIGAHVIRSGVQPYIIDLIKRGFISCVSTNGAGVIHDYEFALIGATTESVARYIKEGQFGLWEETGKINDIVSDAAQKGLGLGESVGKVIETGHFPHKDISILAAAYRLGIPVTVHVGIGYDIVHEHPNCNGAAWGAASMTDFLIYAKVLESLEGGVIMNFGSAVMAPEVFLKALAMVRNVALQHGKKVENFTTLVCDLKSLPTSYHLETPKSDPNYYFRPWKTMLVRTISDTGESYYVQGHHKDTIPELWTAIVSQIPGPVDIR